MLSGIAAGVAASLSVENRVSPREIDIPELRDKLRGVGVKI
jgi:hypothetical protein